MRIPAFVIGAVALAGSAFAWPTATPAASVAGFLDTSNGTFHPAVTQDQLATAAAKTLTRLGTITVVITVAIESAIPTKQQITCNADLSSSDFPLPISNSADASGIVERKGNTGTCRLVIPFQWIVANAQTMMNVDSISVNTGDFGTPGLTRSATTSFPAFPVPSGKKTISVNLSL